MVVRVDIIHPAEIGSLTHLLQQTYFRPLALRLGNDLFILPHKGVGIAVNRTEGILGNKASVAFPHDIAALAGFLLQPRHLFVHKSGGLRSLLQFLFFQNRASFL